MFTLQEWLESKLRKYIDNEEIIRREIEEYNSYFTSEEEPMEVDEDNQSESTIKSSELSTIAKEKDDLKDKEIGRLRNEIIRLTLSSQGDEGQTGELGELISNLEEAKAKIKELELKISSKLKSISSSLIEKIDKEVEVWESNWEIKRLFDEENIGAEIEKFLRNFQEQGEILVKEVLKLKWELIIKQKEVKNLEEKLKKSYGVLQEKMELKRKELNNEKRECLEEMGQNRSLLEKWWDYENTLKTLLKYQEMVSRGNDSDGYFAQEKNKWLEVAPPKFLSKLEKLCQFQHGLTQLEMQLENTKKVIKVFIGVEIGDNNTLGNININDNKIELPPKSNQ